MADDSLLSAEQKFALIEAVRMHPMLYDKVNVDYHNKDRKDKVWSDIAKKPNVELGSGKDAKEAWDRLRTLFKRNHNKKTSSGQAATRDVKWQFYTPMLFLECHSEPRAESQSTLQMAANSSGESSKSSSDEKFQEGMEKKESVFRTPTAPKQRKRTSDQAVEEWFADAIKRLEEKAKPKSRNQLFADMLGSELDDFPEHIQPALRNEILQLVHTRRSQYCYNSPSASPFSASSPASSSTVTNYLVENDYGPSQVLFNDPSQ